MARAIGLLLAVTAIWITAEIYTQGAENAFGGRLAAWIGSGDASRARRGSAAERAGSEVRRAQEEGDARRDALLRE